MPDFLAHTMRLGLKHINFKYATRKRRISLIDRQDIRYIVEKTLFIEEKTISQKREVHILVLPGRNLD